MNIFAGGATPHDTAMNTCAGGATPHETVMNTCAGGATPCVTAMHTCAGGATPHETAMNTCAGGATPRATAINICAGGATPHDTAMSRCAGGATRQEAEALAHHHGAGVTLISGSSAHQRLGAAGAEFPTDPHRWPGVLQVRPAPLHFVRLCKVRASHHLVQDLNED